MRLVRTVVLLALALGACSKGHTREDEEEEQDSGEPDAEKTGDGGSASSRREDATPPGDADAPSPVADAQLGADDASARDASEDVAAEASHPDADAGDASAEAVVCMPRVIGGSQDLADALIVFDRSLSMALFGRWEPTRSALKASVAEFQHRVSFGLEFFPATGSMMCGGTEKLDVPLATGNAAAIAAALDAAQPEGLTPTGAALRSALSILGARRPANGVTPKPGFVLLLTDGEPGCGGSLPDIMQIDAANAASVALREAGIATYVIGYQIDAAQKGVMDGLAMRGGTDHYRAVNNATELSAVLRDITPGLGNACRYSLNASASFAHLQVELDGVAVARDAENGWELVDQSVVFRGNACSTLNDRKPHHVRVREGC